MIDLPFPNGPRLPNALVLAAAAGVTSVIGLVAGLVLSDHPAFVAARAPEAFWLLVPMLLVPPLAALSGGVAAFLLLGRWPPRHRALVVWTLTFGAPLVALALALPGRGPAFLVSALTYAAGSLPTLRLAYGLRRGGPGRYARP